MAQGKETGQKAREFGLQAARELICALGGKQCRKGSNEFIWKGECAVLKSAKPANNIIGVTPKMRPRLDVVVAAYQRPAKKGERLVFDLHAFRKEDFDEVFYKSPPRKDGHRLWFARQADVIKHGERLGSREISMRE